MILQYIKYIPLINYKWSNFHSYVKLPEGIPFNIPYILVMTDVWPWQEQRCSRRFGPRALSASEAPFGLLRETWRPGIRVYGNGGLKIGDTTNITNDNYVYRWPGIWFMDNPIFGYPNNQLLVDKWKWQWQIYGYGELWPFINKEHLITGYYGIKHSIDRV